jgi:predicted metal-dependent HD superfamily phosphohydrolase
LLDGSLACSLIHAPEEVFGALRQVYSSADIHKITTASHSCVVGEALIERWRSRASAADA